MRTTHIISILILCIVSSSAQAMFNPLKRFASARLTRTFSSSTPSIESYGCLPGQGFLQKLLEERNAWVEQRIQERNNAFVCRTALIKRIADLEETNARLVYRCQELFYDGSPETREKISNLKKVIADQSKQIKKLPQTADKSRR